MIPLFSAVEVRSARYLEIGVAPGTIGYVIEDYGDGHDEVEVTRPDGTAVALFSAPESDLEPVAPPA